MSTPLVLSSSGTESFPFVSAISEDAFLVLKKAWKKTNLEKKQHNAGSWLFSSSNTSASVLLNKKMLSPGHIHNEFLRLLQLIVVNNWWESGNNPFPQAEYQILLPEEGILAVISILFPYPCLPVQHHYTWQESGWDSQWDLYAATQTGGKTHCSRPSCLSFWLRVLKSSSLSIWGCRNMLFSHST